MLVTQNPAKEGEWAVGLPSPHGWAGLATCAFFCERCPRLVQNRFGKKSSGTPKPLIKPPNEPKLRAFCLRAVPRLVQQAASGGAGRRDAILNAVQRRKVCQLGATAAAAAAKALVLPHRPEQLQRKRRSSVVRVWH